MSPRRTLNRPLLLLALLLGLVLVLDACSTRRGRSNDDDTSDDDDSGQDDDDSGQGDDDTTAGDDDDIGSPGILDLSADTTNFGGVSIGTQVSTPVYFENLGGTGITGTIELSDVSGVWILQGGTTVNIAPFATQTRTLVFQPSAATSYSLALDAEHDGANSSPQQLLFAGAGGGGGGGTETSCIDGVDNDGDTLVDCADPDCATDPACTGGADPCCAANTQFANGPCQDATVEGCVCAADAFCCTDWDLACVNQYIGTTGSCGPASTCGS